MVNKYDMAYGSHMLLGHSCQSKGENIWKLGNRARDGGGRRLSVSRRRGAPRIGRR